MNIMVIYHTLTGNTEKIARAIYTKAVQSGYAEIRKIDTIDPEELKKIRLIFIGSPCHAGDLAMQVKEFLNNMPASPNFSIAGFVTHAAPVFETRDFEKCRHSFEELCREKNIEFLDFFDCQGFLTPDLHNMIKKALTVSDEGWEKMVLSMKGHPDAGDEMKAGEFASRIIRSIEQSK